MKTTVIGLLGPTLDTGKRASRWERWRPTVGLCQQKGLTVQRFDLLYQPRFKGLMQRVSEDIRTVSPTTEVVPHPITLRNPWDFEEVFGVLHDFAAAYAFDPEHEDYLVHITTGSHVAQICLFLLTEARYFPARLVQTGPAKRIRGQDTAGTHTIIDLDLSRYDQLARRFQKELDDDLSFLKSGIATRNPDFNRLIEKIEQVALHSVDPILLTGPTGAGKSRLARRVFDLKRARHQLEGEFVEVNCATLRGDAAMSTLFGHQKGAFTGALQDRPGLLRAADRGMLFLDEIGELGMDEQSMLLRAIEEKTFLPMGSDRETRSDFQLICGTNHRLENDVQKGDFREDLLARINLWTFRMPGLRDRREDIEPNLEYELDQFARRTGRRVTFNKEARRRFLDFAVSPGAVWRANFRDLNGAVTRMATLAPGGRITPAEVEEEKARLRTAWEVVARPMDSGQPHLQSILTGEQRAAIDPFDRVHLEEVLRVCRQSHNLSEAGRRLFAVSRQAKKTPNDADRLRKYLLKFGLKWEDIAAHSFALDTPPK
jgi:transcriptional regulatory protein RtcR